MSVSPATTFNLPGGSLRPGNVADVTVFDATREWTVDPARFVSKGRNSPYGGYSLYGRVMCTIVGGKIVHRATG
jgi:dihydroorotase